MTSGRREGAKLPKIFCVNWFRKDEDGHFLWPGYGENSRVLDWIFGRCEGTAEAVESPIGYLPAPGAIETEGLDVSEERHDASSSRPIRSCGKPSSRRCTSTLPASATASPPRSGSSSRRSSSGSEVPKTSHALWVAGIALVVGAVVAWGRRSERGRSSRS